MSDLRLTRIEAGTLSGRRPRSAGSNARLPEHGLHVHEPFARLTFDDGSDRLSGFGYSRVSEAQAHALLGRTLDSLLSVERGVAADARSIEFPLWDALGQRANLPIYRLVGAAAAPLTIPCYDTTLYFDDLHLTDEAAAVALIADEARAGYERGHRAFKIKVGRGAMHLPLSEGTHRDIAIIRGVRAAVGAGLPLMIDANNGYNLNLVKWVLEDTADCDLSWLEEPFHEDRVLYAHLHEWMQAQGLNVLIADGESQPPDDLPEWARDGIVDVIQYDLRLHGFSNWLATGRQLDAWGVKSAPHNYGSAFGNYAACHLAGVVRHFALAEWDQIDLDGLDTSSYRLVEGRIHLPDAPGFGLRLDDALFGKSVTEGGFTVNH